MVDMDVIYRGKIKKVGASMVVLIPKKVLKLHGIKIGDELEVTPLKKYKLKLINEAFGIAKDAPSFKRPREVERK